MKNYVLVAVLITLFGSCESIIEVDPPRTQLTKLSVFQDDQTATAAISGLYAQLTSGLGSGGFTSLTYMTSLSSDELQVEAGAAEYRQFYENEILSVNTINAGFWQGQFSGIYLANSIIEGLQGSSKITAALKNQLIGEAKFIRAFYHFYLVNLFGDIPYITTTDYRLNSLVSRAPVSAVYDKIIDDLMEAKTLLADDYSYVPSSERIRVNKWAAACLLARTYLYKEDWIHAEEQATSVINKNSLYSLSNDLNDVFLKNSKETIWQLVPSAGQHYVSEGGIFNRGYDPDVAILTDDLISSFETNDGRGIKWIVSGKHNEQSWSHPLKYKETAADGTGKEYYTVFRLAEQFLIRAEARAKQNKLTGVNSAKSDIDVIRNRAGLLNTTAETQLEILDAIEHEKRVELFVEWGHRWLDLKRTKKATSVLNLLKPKWSDTDALYPIPYSELQLNPNMTQNLGY